MNIKTNLLEEYVSYVDTTKTRYKKLLIFTNILVFILILLLIIRFIQVYK